MQQVESRSRRNPSSQFHHHHHHRGDDGLVNIYYISISRMSFGFVFRKWVNVIKISLSAITFLLILAAEARCKPSSPSYKNKHFSLFEKVLLKPDRQTRGKKKEGGAVRMCGIEAWPQDETVLAVSNFSQFLPWKRRLVPSGVSNVLQSGVPHKVGLMAADRLHALHHWLEEHAPDPRSAWAGLISSWSDAHFGLLGGDGGGGAISNAAWAVVGNGPSGRWSWLLWLF